MRRAVLKLPLHLIRQRIAVGFAGLARHRDAAEGVNAAAQRPVCLQADDDLPLLIQISGTVICQRGYRLRIDIQHAAKLPFKVKKMFKFFHEGFSALRWAAEKLRALLIRPVICLDKIPHIDGLKPSPLAKTLPFLSHTAFLPFIIKTFPPCALFHVKHEKGQHRKGMLPRRSALYHRDPTVVLHNYPSGTTDDD